MTNRIWKGVIALILLTPLAVFVFDFGDIYVSPPVPSAPQIQTIRHMKVVLFTIALIGGGGFMLLVIYSHTRGSFRETAAKLQPGWNRTIFGSFIGVVTLIMAITILMNGGALAQMGTAPAAGGHAGPAGNPQHLDVDVVAHQWAFKFHYNNPSVGDKYVFHAPADTWIKVRVTSTDVVHSFSMQRLGIKVDAVPGQENIYWFKAPAKPGTYQINCAELCGSGHSQMKAQFVVESPQKFSTWAQQQGGNFSVSGNGGA